MSLNLYTYAHNNPVRYIDLRGHAVTEWDKEYLSTNELHALYWLTLAWNTANAAGDQVAMDDAHAKAVAIRAQYLQRHEYVRSDGQVSFTSLPAPT